MKEKEYTTIEAVLHLLTSPGDEFEGDGHGDSTYVLSTSYNAHCDNHAIMLNTAPLSLSGAWLNVKWRMKPRKIDITEALKAYNNCRPIRSEVSGRVFSRVASSHEPRGIFAASPDEIDGDWVVLGGCAMSNTIKTQGFGFYPEESLQHFLVCIPSKSECNVMVYERFNWQDDVLHQSINVYEDKAKVEISKQIWKLLEDAIRREFNSTLKKQKLPSGKFVNGQVPVERLLGKELVLLLWAVEDCDPVVIPAAIKNWLGLAREERWWLYTMTNAATGNLYDRNGWRKAIKYALTENPIYNKTVSMNKEENREVYNFL